MNRCSRLTLVMLLLTMLVMAMVMFGVTRRAVTLSLYQVWETLNGHTSQAMQSIVIEWRLPRLAVALLVGSALGSPDVMGFNTGVWSGVLVAMVLFNHNQHQANLVFAAMTGGMVTSLVVWLLVCRFNDHACY